MLYLQRRTMNDVLTSWHKKGTDYMQVISSLQIVLVAFKYFIV